MHLCRPDLSWCRFGAKMEVASEISGGTLQEIYGGSLRLSSGVAMTTTDPTPQDLLARPKRADAQRNYAKLLAAAREAFAEGGESTSLEEIARRAGVGIGTLYRHFPTRQALLEALYVEEVDEVCRSASRAEGDDAWSDLNEWFD